MFFISKWGTMGKHIEDIAQSDSEGCQKQIKDALANPFHSFSSHLFLIIKHRQSSDHLKVNIINISIYTPSRFEGLHLRRISFFLLIFLASRTQIVGKTLSKHWYGLLSCRLTFHLEFWLMVDGARLQIK